jgi:heme-degrading monooxygenase HmoA
MSTTTATPQQETDGAPAPAGEFTVTSIFTLRDQQRQDHLFALLSTNGHDVLEHLPGFLGSTLTRCDDGLHIIHHARWRDLSALAAMLADPGAQATMTAARPLADVQIFRSHHSETFAGPRP